MRRGEHGRCSLSVWGWGREIGLRNVLDVDHGWLVGFWWVEGSGEKPWASDGGNRVDGGPAGGGALVTEEACAEDGNPGGPAGWECVGRKGSS